MNPKDLKRKLNETKATMSERLMGIYVELLKESQKKTKQLKQMIKSLRETKCP